MLAYGIFEISIIAGLATTGAAMVMGLVWLGSTATQRVGARRYATGSLPTFLFDGEDLVDSTPDARSLIATAPAKMSKRQAVVHVFRDRFPTLYTDIMTLGPGDTKRVLSADHSPNWLELADIGGRVRLTLNGTQGDYGMGFSDRVLQDAMASELSFLRQLTENAPQQIWQQDGRGHVIWANRAYLGLSDKLNGATAPEMAWPEKPVFADLHFDVPEARSIQRRVSIRQPDHKTDTWFEVTSIREGDTTLHYATDANNTVIAEQARIKLLQTLSKTFAHLSVGLAIFDHTRQLTSFNPALMDLTRMSPEFLSSRPTVDMFLDTLREARILPEPKNYADFREQFHAVEDAARQGIYAERWNLPDGLTYQVTGKPHTDGAFAFFFEDISAEVALTRRFRSDIETGQHVLDTLPEAIAVFSGSGTLVMSNKAYSDLWNLSDEVLFDRQDIKAELSVWQQNCAASPIWGELRDFIGSTGPRTIWEDTAVLDDGRRVDCAAKPIPGGMTMVTFKITAATRPIIQMLTREDPALLVGKR